MIWVSEERPARDGLRLPSRRLRPSPKPNAVAGTPIARMSAVATAARPEKEILFIRVATQPLKWSCGLKQGFRPPVVFPATPRLRPGHGRRVRRPCDVYGCLALARLLLGIDRNRDLEIQGGADDPVLLDRVGGRVALARRRALGTADVAELDVGREDLQQARR